MRDTLSGSVQDCSISSAFAPEIQQSCTKPFMSLFRPLRERWSSQRGFTVTPMFKIHGLQHCFCYNPSILSTSHCVQPWTRPSPAVNSCGTRSFLTWFNSLRPDYASVNLVNIGSDNGWLPVWYQAISWTSVALLLIGPSGTNLSMLSEIWMKIQISYMYFIEENAFENVFFFFWASMC